MGAWIGPTALHAAFKAKRVYALEPDKAAFRELRKNFSLNPRLKRKANCLNAALAPDRESGWLYAPAGFGRSSSTTLKQPVTCPRRKIKKIDIRWLEEKFGLGDLNLIKIDIEGGEYQLLPAMKDFLRKNAPAVYLSLHPPRLASPFIKKGQKASFLAKALIYLISRIPAVRLWLSLKHYRYFYDRLGRSVSTFEFLFSRRFGDFNLLLATNRKWPVCAPSPPEKHRGPGRSNSITKKSAGKRDNSRRPFSSPL